VSYSGDANYAANNVGTHVTVNLPDFSLTPGASSIVVTANQEKASTTIALTPTNALSSTVTFQCYVPDVFNATCSVTPASAPLDGQPVNLTVALAADGSGISNPQSVPKISAKRKSFVLLWWNRDPGNWGWAVLALAMLAIAFWPGNRKSRSYGVQIAMSSAMLMAIGCGGGGSNGSTSSTGGGTPAPVDSTVTMTLASSKTTSNVSVNATATVTSSKTPTGQVEFLAQNFLADLVNPTPLTNGSVTSLLPNLETGIFQVYAKYTGDSFTKSAQSTATPLTVTGTGTIIITASNGVVTHTQSLNVQVQ
jgi:hypothetical protein